MLRACALRRVPQVAAIRPASRRAGAYCRAVPPSGVAAARACGTQAVHAAGHAVDVEGAGQAQTWSPASADTTVLAQSVADAAGLLTGVATEYVAAISELLVSLHSWTGLPWWATIAVRSRAVRGAARSRSRPPLRRPPRSRCEACSCRSRCLRCA